MVCQLLGICSNRSLKISKRQSILFTTCWSRGSKTSTTRMISSKRSTELSLRTKKLNFKCSGTKQRWRVCRRKSMTLNSRSKRLKESINLRSPKLLKREMSSSSKSPKSSIKRLSTSTRSKIEIFRWASLESSLNRSLRVRKEREKKTRAQIWGCRPRLKSYHRTTSSFLKCLVIAI